MLSCSAELFLAVSLSSAYRRERLFEEAQGFFSIDCELRSNSCQLEECEEF